MATKTSVQPVATPTVIATADLGEKLSGHRLSLAHLRQVVISYQANLRRSTADTKKRGEVSGGGRKPWRQKGTGRARVGSSRTPVWRGGGIVFGPTTAKNYTQSITKTSKLRSLADAIVLKVKAGQAFQVDLPADFNHKTSAASRVLAQLPETRTMLIVVPEMRVGQGFANLPGAYIMTPSQLTAGNVSTANYLVFVNGTWEVVKAKFE